MRTPSSEEGEVVVRVWIEPTDGDEAVLHVAVTDTGIGIPVEKQALIFDGKTYPVSTAKNGPGEKNGSLCTPR